MTAAEPLRQALAGRYTLERELGRGGMATVYLAHDLKYDRQVALKVLHPELAVTLAPERFQREISVAARLQHPHILTVLDSGEIAVPGAPAILWFTMPYIRGETLRARLNRERQLSLEDALRIAQEAADALGYAHQEGIVHRDVKPENILLSGTHAMVADFGIARAVTGGSNTQRLTETGLTVGTPAYMSPEQASGAIDLDARSDVYSLGCVIYEMLAGEPPFAGPTPQAMIARRFTETPRPLRQMRDSVPESVERTVAKALARTPADRFSTGVELALALESSRTATSPTTSAVTPPSAPSTPPPPPAAKTAERPAVRLHRRAPLTLALSVGFLLGLGVLFGWLRRHGDGNEMGAGPKLVAVLPFQNLGDSTDEYFADGITDEVRGKLATLPGLQVIASGSASQYKGTTKSPQVIAKELGVSYILIGKIRWEKQQGGQSRVRVSPELVQVPPGGTATTRWQRAFDASITDVFQVQADIASRVAQALNVALEDSTQQQLAAKPTQNLAAYDAYLKGVEAVANSGSPVGLRQGIDQFDRAVALDTAFAAAWARLSDATSLLAISSASPGQLRSRALYAANRALALAPDRPEGHLALGNYYRRIESDYAKAIREYDTGQGTGRTNAELSLYKGIALAALGRSDEATEQLRQASILDPRSSSNASSYAANLRHLHRYAEAREADDRAVALSPTNVQSLLSKILTLLSSGDLAAAQAAIQSPPAGVDLPTLAAYLATFNELYWALPAPVQDIMLRLPPTAFDDDRGAWGLALSGVYWLRGDSAKVRVYADSARIAMKEQVDAEPTIAQLHSLYGTALAYVGRRDDAEREGLKGVEMQPVTKDASNGPYIVHQLVRIYIINGQYDKALDELEKLLTMQYDVSPGWLRIDPLFNPLRKNPRFQKLVAGVS